MMTITEIDVSSDYPIDQSNEHTVTHVEACVNPHSTEDYARIAKEVERFCGDIQAAGFLREHQHLTDYKHIPFLLKHVDSIHVCEIDRVAGPGVNRLNAYVYQMNQEEAVDEVDPEENITSFREWTLPSNEFSQLWNTLIYDNDIPGRLLRYVEATMIFADLEVNSDLISWNRVVLLYGPPGTGKTSLCRALAQKLSIRMFKRYDYGKLIEINAHSLFSKWFSESGKLVMKLFQHLNEIIEDDRGFVCLLIDEVESLAAARKSSGSEPSDSIRVVNAFLTQLDKLKNRKNVLILTTSNICGAIDLAFVDRADIKQFIGMPGTRAIYEIFKSSLNELISKGVLISKDKFMDSQTAEMLYSSIDADEDSEDISAHLWLLSAEAAGMSGRMLRKLPFLAFSSLHSTSTLPIPISAFLQALRHSVQQENRDRSNISKSFI